MLQSGAEPGERVMPLLVAVDLNHIAVNHACYVANQFYDVNIPITPAMRSTEVVKTVAIFGPSKTMLGSALTLQNGKRYIADLGSQGSRSRESYELLRALGVREPEKSYAASMWPLTKQIPSPFFTVSCK